MPLFRMTESHDMSWPGFRMGLGMKWVAVVCGVALNGCSGTNYFPQPPYNPEAKRADIISLQKRNCSDYGFKAGTEAFATCMQNGINARNQAEQMALNQQAQARAAFAATMMRQQPVYLPPMQTMPVNGPRNCISNTLGNSIYTNCY